jgi:hypothetical protein
MARNMTEVQDPNAGQIEKLFAKFEKFGDFVEGHFAKSLTQKGVGTWPDGRPKGDQEVYEFIDEAGGLLCVGGSADINAKMGLVSIGSFTRIEYASDRATKRGTMKVFKVSTDASDRKSEAAISAAYAALEEAAKAAAAAGAEAPVVDPNKPPF